MSEKLTLTITTELEELTRLSSAVEELGEREGWPPDLVFRVNLALEELGINVMNYGHDEGVHEIEITLTPETGLPRHSDDGRWPPLRSVYMTPLRRTSKARWKTGA